MPKAFTNTGYIPKHNTLPVKPDERNWEYTPAKSGILPTFFKTDISKIPPYFGTAPIDALYQKDEPSCVAHAVTFAVMYNYWLATGTVVLLSPRFLYAMCKTIDGIPADGGTYLETALNLAKNVGICEDSYFPNDCTLDVATYANPALIPQAAKDNAAKYKIPSYSFIASPTRSKINSAIYNDGIVVIGQKVSDTWWTSPIGVTSWQEKDILPIRPPSPGHDIVSGHCTVEYSYGQYAHGINWWSKNWGYQGLYWYGVTEQPFVYEAAIVGQFPKPSAPQPTPPTPQLGLFAWFLKTIMGKWG